MRSAAAPDERPLDADPFAAQAQFGIDWNPSPRLGAHLHLIARDDDGARRGNVGIAEGYVEANFRPGRDRVRIRGGAFFLPTSRENVDALWENPYAISSSALNSWLGEELRPIGIDATYMRRGAFLGATIFRGNDTLGAVPPVIGWSLGDRWTLLGEHVPVDADFTSVSAETDNRLGWSARGGWNRDNLTLQFTHFDNRSDGLLHGDLLNWGTRFNIAAAEYTLHDWTVAAEGGWGPTFVFSPEDGSKWVSYMRAGYAFVSRRWSDHRATLRVDAFGNNTWRFDHAFTVAYFRTIRPKMRIGGELTTMGNQRRAMVEVRYYFSRR